MMLEALTDQKIEAKQVFAVPELKVARREDCGRASVEFWENGMFFYLKDGEKIRHGFSCADTESGRHIGTDTAVLVSRDTEAVRDTIGDGVRIRSLYEENGLSLRQEITLYPQGELVVQIFLREKGAHVRTRYLAPFFAPYPDASGKRIFLSLDQKMLLVPYDNDMWLRYESCVPAAGRPSYDVTAIYDEDTMEGMVIGALDFDVWKNAIRWNGHDARSLIALCGIADGGTHDCCPHGIVEGEEVASSRFLLSWQQDIRRGMEHYGDLCARICPPRPWESGRVPFGWNSFAALGKELTLEHWKQAGQFMAQELPNYCDEDGVSYVNLDGAVGLDMEEIRRSIEQIHARGQKAGWYAAPCNCRPQLGNLPVKGTGLKVSDLFLRDGQGRVLPAADGTVPFDVTHPVWEEYARRNIRILTDLGIDYIKIDFLSHGSAEGDHYVKNTTGRMALNRMYRLLEEEIGRCGREIFVSLSIAPLFPYFLGNARRSCCDSFGHHDDVRYVLNALNFAWWTNGRIYRYNDPDHVPLYHAVIDGRGTVTENEAKSRYYAAAISGTVMMLSDNYGPSGKKEIIENARDRARRIANDEAVNRIARLGKAFVPVELRDGTTPFYTLCLEGRFYAAVFNFSDQKAELSFEACRGGLPQTGSFADIHGGEKIPYSGKIRVTLEGWDAVLLEVFEEKK
ncbi:MAG: hypothetical protein Q4C65_04365 [Eubacteriales bacterium]|nr:hypothetical protein [Eubacteriales bacterium]